MCLEDVVGMIHACTMLSGSHYNDLKKAKDGVRDGFGIEIHQIA